MAEEPKEQDEVVHYQISVTGRQAALFFAVVLFALSLAFFFGMKTGAASRPAGEPRKVAEATPAEEAPPDADVKASTSAPPARPDDFEKKLGFPDDSEKPSKPVPTREPEAKPTKAPRPSPTPARPDTPAPPPKVVAQATPKATPPKPVEKQEAPSTVYVQVLVTKEAEKADRYLRQLKDAGFKTADVYPVPGSAGLFRVRLGPYKDRAFAEGVARRVKKSLPELKPGVVKP